jgi:AcrR family transcriptional regulator
MDRTRSRLVRAARRAFAEKGFAAASMDELTATAGLTRGALYHHFGGKNGLLEAVIAEIDAEMLVRMADARRAAPTLWEGFIAECLTYIELALDGEVQRIVLQDGPAVLGDPSSWPGQNECLARTAQTLRDLVEEGMIDATDPEATAYLLNGAALNAASWVAGAEDPAATLPKAKTAFLQLVEGLRRG